MADTPHVHVEFFIEPVEKPALSIEAGRPIFEDTEFVRLRFVGDPKSSFVAPANDPAGRDRESGQPYSWAQKYPDHYRHFKNNQDQQAAAGTPLTEVPWLTAAKRAELKALNIMTVEGLAQLDGALLQRIGMGARELKNKAQAYLDAANTSAPNTKMASELAAAQDEIAALRQQMTDFMAMQSGKVPASETLAPATQTEPETPSNSPFENWQDEDIKNWIKEATGAKPQGNPAHKTLVAKADEINAELAARKAA
jgi:hypothetical protein